MAIDLLTHQKKGLSWLKIMENTSGRDGGLLCDQMGVGKTIQMIALMLVIRN